jgi:transcriptional regulator with GAF, ATPase, and Fis domain
VSEEAESKNAEAQHRQSVDVLSAGIQDITNAMVEDFKLTDVLRMILETMLRALEFDRIIFCMRDAKTEMMTGRFGLGNGVEAYVKGFQTHLKANTPDIFGVVCIKGADSMISNATEAHIAKRLPAWFREGINAPSFLLLPLQIKGAPFGLIYADKATPGELDLDEKQLALLRTLRNQAVMAFKQSS